MEVKSSSKDERLRGTGSFQIFNCSKGCANGAWGPLRAHNADPGQELSLGDWGESAYGLVLSHFFFPLRLLLRVIPDHKI